VGGGDAARALDRGWEAAAAPVDGEPRQRQCFGEVWSSGEREAVEMQARDGKSEFVMSSRTCFRSRRRHGRAGATAGKPAARVEKQGDASAGREAAGGVQERHVAQREAAWEQLELGTWPARAAGSGREKTERGTGGRRRGT
jgi:hypothetical protein